MRMTRRLAILPLLTLSAWPASSQQLVNADFSNGTSGWNWYEGVYSSTTISCPESIPVKTNMNGAVRQGKAYLTYGHNWRDQKRLCERIEQRNIQLPAGMHLVYNAQLGLPNSSNGIYSNVGLRIEAIDEINPAISASASHTGQSSTSSHGVVGPHEFSLDVSDLWGRTAKLRLTSSTYESVTGGSSPSGRYPSPSIIDYVSIERMPLTQDYRYIWMTMPASSSGTEGFVRITNLENRPGKVSLFAIGQNGDWSRKVTFAIAGNESKAFTATDLQAGNASKGLMNGWGTLAGPWAVLVRSELAPGQNKPAKLEPLSYVRIPDGSVASIHDKVWKIDGKKMVPMFNPGSNPGQVSQLRLFNPSTQPITGSIRGVDDAGSVRGPVTFGIPAQSTVQLSAMDLENGNPAKGVGGALGQGTGKWRLEVTSSDNVVVQSLLYSHAGKVANISTRSPTGSGVLGQSQIWMIPSASNIQNEGVLRIINIKDSTNSITITGHDDAGNSSSGSVTLQIPSRGSFQLTSSDLQNGNPSKGVMGGLGQGTGNWRLSFTSTHGIIPLAYVRNPDGHLSAIHDVVAGNGTSFRVPMFNPASNSNQVSYLRLTNPNQVPVQIQVQGIKDNGSSGAGTASITIAARQSVQLSASDLENGNSSKGVSGGIGPSNGKWALQVTSSSPTRVMNLLYETNNGVLTNISTGTSEWSGNLD